MNMTVAKKMTLLVLVALIGLVSISTVAQIEMGRVFTSANFVNDNTVPSIVDLGRARFALMEMRLNLLKHVDETDAAKAEQF